MKRRDREVQSHEVLWRRVDLPGHEAAQLRALGKGWRLAGVAVFLHESLPCQLDYIVTSDNAWQTTAVSVSGLVGKKAISLELRADSKRRWSVNGVGQPALLGCVDIDLSFSPATNLLPIRRLNLHVGQQGTLDAAWVRFPELSVERLDQVYRRVKNRLYRFESGGGSFKADLSVDEVGWVLNYPGQWEVVRGSRKATAA
jgi:hypothetical protein